jgi:ATP-dependent Lon protease
MLNQDNRGGFDSSEAPRNGPAPIAVDSGPKEGHFTFAENQKGVTFDVLFGPYLAGAQKITITDPYVRAFYQIRNLMD